METVIKRKYAIVIAVCAFTCLMFPAFVAYASTAGNALAAEQAAINVAKVQNAYQKIDVLEEADKLEANASEMDKYLDAESLDARVPWYQTYGAWEYVGVLQDTSGNPCVMWLCRENVGNASSVVYAFATATYISTSDTSGYFTAVKHRPTAQGVAALPTTAHDTPKAEQIISMVDEIREQMDDAEPVDEEGREAADLSRLEQRYRNDVE